MSGGFIALTLALVYFVYIYLLWRGAHKSDPTEKQYNREHSAA